MQQVQDQLPFKIEAPSDQELQKRFKGQEYWRDHYLAEAQKHNSKPGASHKKARTAKQRKQAKKKGIRSF
ncbi:hypothetical protein [Pseudoalteromonas sp.]|uniref:hypothetical protein n=1 Tax=Pseudoalteromonas sp. TaxID=53249 RepID=UPI00272A5A7F|nr:hypothetical protein [Pseudoalteromonas sp.]